MEQVVTKRELIDQDQIQKSADQFIATVKTLLPHFNKNSVLNTDQSGLQLEFPSSRTLSYRGEKTTLATVKSKNATTHSYTIQPTISLGGQIVGPIYVCLKEVNGRMSENIKEKLTKYENVVIICSKSGKLSTSLGE